MKNRFLQLDLSLQSLLLLYFLVCILLGTNPVLYYLLLCQLVLGSWQMLSAAICGFIFADYFRSQFFMVAVFVLAGMAIALNLPELRDSELLPLLANFGAIIMMSIYFFRTYQDVLRGIAGKNLA